MSYRYMLCVAQKSNSPVEKSYYDDFEPAITAYTQACANNCNEVLLADLTKKEVIRQYSRRIATNGLSFFIK